MFFSHCKLIFDIGADADSHAVFHRRYELEASRGLDRLLGQSIRQTSDDLYLPSFFSVSGASRDKAKLFQVAPGLLSGCRLDCPILFYVSTRFREFQVKAAVLALLDFKHGGADSIKVVKHEGQSVKASS